MSGAGADEISLITAARRGDPVARERLVVAYLPLVYNVVGRALNGHADVDDVVQDTMLRALSGLDGLRDPERFRPWLVAIAMNQVRRRWSGSRQPPLPLETAADGAVEGDFAELTILRLGLSGQRREVAEATRWLDDGERSALSLWWLEAAGELTRGEVAAALGLNRAHAAVRVQRVKGQLDVCRQVVRALGARERCAELDALTGTWDGVPSPLWRKRIARHARGCETCARSADDLLPVDGLLAGVGLVAVPFSLHSGAVAGHGAAAALGAGHGIVSHAATAHRVLGTGRRALGHGTAAKVTGACAAVAVAVLVVVIPQGPDKGDDAAPPVRPTVSAQAPSNRPASPHASPSPSATKATPKPSPARTRTPASVSPAAAEAASRLDLLGRTNALRARNGCAPLKTDARLTRVAQSDARVIAADRSIDLTGGQNGSTGDRVTAAGYTWSSVGEAAAYGDKNAAAVAQEWANNQMRQFLLDCRFTDVGVGLVVSGSQRAWTEVLAAPR
ncbi:sigma-70 family RNA polymerase sigma factor [Streptomyces sp. L2]|uniref:sigma-70 family RNA polymerase sigma factor n=1 Tax=Streptomyces sp. L2 TaxID=2162665 RepID=UPI001010B169|nr:sigma-70 family RNA polymerase sigma factor [Streptomyces sp. L2]